MARTVLQSSRWITKCDLWGHGTCRHRSRVELWRMCGPKNGCPISCGPDDSARQLRRNLMDSPLGYGYRLSRAETVAHSISIPMHQETRNHQDRKSMFLHQATYMISWAHFRFSPAPKIIHNTSHPTERSFAFGHAPTAYQIPAPQTTIQARPRSRNHSGLEGPRRPRRDSSTST